MINSINVSDETNKKLTEQFEISEQADQIESTTKHHNNEIDNMKIQANEKKQSEIKDLMGKLNEDSEIQDQNDILYDCEKRVNDGKNYFNALNGDQEAIQRKIKELGYVNKSTWITTSQYFLGLDDLNEEDLQKEYIKYFEPQTSVYYLGGVINAVLARAFDMGFFSAMNGKEGKVDEKFSKTIRITQKLVNISRKRKAAQI
ncbi:MAG TPA: hypothetical protein PK674_03430 [Candidatus Absconditabacterales bacterium]|nr:hypothetical protein [Candidatus Absconditabacterales bacterium]HOG15613.1 hypothetical protein [Candidatus Absconditabacterales bacterium]